MHTFHIAKNKINLEARFEIIKAVREFFWSQNFVEVETPLIVAYPGMEPNISAMKLDVHNEQGKTFQGYLHTSPEYTMKKMLSAGFTKIFYLGKTFRDHESFGGLHNPEFTMLEFYRVESDMFQLIDDIKNMINFVIKKLEIGNWKLDTNHQLLITNYKSIHMRDLWKKVIDIDLDKYLTREKMLELCREKKYNVKDDESYEELFYRIFLDEIEPKLKDIGAVFVHHYPAQMAALSKLSETDPRYAERVELYIDGVEIANGFSELTDADEQLQRLQDEQVERKRQDKDVYAIDMEFIESLKTMPASAGIALGVDRLVQVLLSCKNIDDVLVLPMSKLL